MGGGGLGTVVCCVSVFCRYSFFLSKREQEKRGASTVVLTTRKQVYTIISYLST